MLEDLPDLLTTSEAASVYRLKPQTMALRRLRGLPPKFIKANGRILYRKQDVLAHLEGSSRTSTASTALAPDSLKGGRV